MRMMSDIDLHEKSVLIREDFNVPLKDGNIMHTARIDAALPTLRAALAQGAKVIVMSHLGRPEEGHFDASLSLKPVADYLQHVLKQPVTFFQLQNGAPTLAPGEIALLENVRFLPGEEDNSDKLGQQLAALCDVFVMDAFAVAHRAQASTCSVAHYAPVVCAGPLLQKELQAIDAILRHPKQPVVGIVGGSKISTKIQLLDNLLEKVDTLIVGGGIANTFLASQNYPIGKSLCEKDGIALAKQLFQKAQSLGKTIVLPEDVVVAQSLEESGIVKNSHAVSVNDCIFDIGPLSQQHNEQCLMQAKTILWNGPVGVFEVPAFSKGTQALAKAIEKSQAFSVAGGGDTLSAISQFHVEKGISYLSTGGGAFLEALEGKTLPGVAALLQKGDVCQDALK